MSSNFFRLFTDVQTLQLAVMSHCCEQQTACVSGSKTLSPLAEEHVKLLLRRSQVQAKNGSVIPGTVEHDLVLYSLASFVPSDVQSTKKPPVDRKATPKPSTDVPAPRSKHPEGSIAALLQQKSVPDNILNAINGFFRSRKRISFVAPREEGYFHTLTSTKVGQTQFLHERCGICNIIRESGKELNHHDMILAVSAHCKGFNVALAQTISSVVLLEVARREDNRNASRRSRAAKKKQPEDGDQTME